MEKSELMKRYEAETGKRFSHMQKRAVEGDINCTMSTGYVAWLEAQLTWRPVREKPKEGQIVFVMVSTGWVVAQYLDGGFYVDDGFTFGDFISGVSHWLPIPPAPEGGRKMTREHRAWEMLIRRLNYLNSFGGNRSEMEKTTRIVAEIWDDTGHEEEPVTTLLDGWEEKCSHSI